MRTYVYGIICASLAIGVAELLIPEGAKTRPYLKLILGLAMLLAIVKPIGELVTMLPDFGELVFEEPEMGDEYAQIADEQLAEAYKKGIEADLKDKFGLSDFEVGVIMGDDRKPIKVTVTLMGGDIFRNPYKIEEYITRAFGCECVTLVG